MAETRRPDSQEAVILEIVRYIVAHPEAKDTIEGVMRWWLPEGLPERRREDVEAGLAVLVARGFIVERVIATARKIYCANKERIAEMNAAVDHE